MAGQRRGTERMWLVEPDRETGEVDAQEAAQVAVDVANLLRMAGGTVSCHVEREEFPPGSNLWHTTGMLWRWHSWAPQSNVVETVEQARAAVASEFQQPEAEPQEPPPGEGDPGEFDGEPLAPTAEDAVSDDELMPLSAEARADLEREGVAVR